MHWLCKSHSYIGICDIFLWEDRSSSLKSRIWIDWSDEIYWQVAPSRIHPKHSSSIQRSPFTQRSFPLSVSMSSQYAPIKEPTQRMFGNSFISSLKLIFIFAEVENGGTNSTKIWNHHDHATEINWIYALTFHLRSLVSSFIFWIQLYHIWFFFFQGCKIPSRKYGITIYGIEA